MAAIHDYPSVQMHSIYVSTLGNDAESPSGVDDNTKNEAPTPRASSDADNLNDVAVDHLFDDSLDQKEEIVNHELQLPPSTHTLFFTEKICSLPYAFAIGIAIMSCLCLILVLANNLDGGSEGNPFNVPANVSTSVRAAQYLSILVALLMEEEIPTGLYLLRMISKATFQNKFPDMKYEKFVFASILRICLGYSFLINVFFVIIQADGVIDIFYDVLALQFVEQLDDIAFRLAKMDVLGKRLELACTEQCFQTEFEKHKKLGRRSKRISLFLKGVYFLNFCVFLSGMIVLSTRQTSGYYQCHSITVGFADNVWAESWVRTPSGQYEEWLLVYSYFSGVYIQDGTSAGRPIYKEMRKFDRTPYEEVVPAEIRYCEEINAWVFTHESIQKSTSPDEVTLVVLNY